MKVPEHDAAGGPARPSADRLSPDAMREIPVLPATTAENAQSPLLKMAQTTPTAYWNDSCAADELKYAIARGAVGATSNPSIVLDVMRRERDYWDPRVRRLALENPTWSEVELTWAVVDEMVVRAAEMLRPVFEGTRGNAGRISVQTNPANYPDAAKMVEQAVAFNRLAPNIQVKLPTTAAGLVAMEEATRLGVNINATVSFTVAQAVAAAEAVERGLRRRAEQGGDIASMTPVVTMMVGRLDDWMKALVERDGIAIHPDAPNWAGVAAFKRAYGIFVERGYRAQLLAAAYRHRLHWTEFVGGNVILTMPHVWQVRFNGSGIAPAARMDEPVDPMIVDELMTRIPDFRRAYEPDGLGAPEFASYGASTRTLRSFVKSYHDLQATIRDLMLPDPDSSAG